MKIFSTKHYLILTYLKYKFLGNGIYNVYSYHILCKKGYQQKNSKTFNQRFLLNQTIWLMLYMNLMVKLSTVFFFIVDFIGGSSCSTAPQSLLISNKVQPCTLWQHCTMMSVYWPDNTQFNGVQHATLCYLYNSV